MDWQRTSHGYFFALQTSFLLKAKCNPRDDRSHSLSRHLFMRVRLTGWIFFIQVDIHLTILGGPTPLSWLPQCRTEDFLPRPTEIDAASQRWNSNGRISTFVTALSRNSDFVRTLANGFLRFPRNRRSVFRTRALREWIAHTSDGNSRGAKKGLLAEILIDDVGGSQMPVAKKTGFSVVFRSSVSLKRTRT